MVHVFNQTLTRPIMDQLQMHKPFIRTHLRINQPSYQMSDIVMDQRTKKFGIGFCFSLFLLLLFVFIEVRNEYFMEHPQIC